ncbi:MAG TPA: thioredoxin family protein [Casimicrobiaceae bacterium]|jgi:thioredoxin reductase (NADPH)|nr:thioredoxin family protein [Casimicrobiaceae bacterium]
MDVITPNSQEYEAQVGRWIDRATPTVIALCAAWCDTCGEFRATLERIARARPEIVFVWLDIEDDSAICGDIDVENFPTLAIYRGERLLHYGVSLPQEGTVARLIDEIAKRPDGTVSAPQAVLDLPQKLRAHARGQAT